jgi:hypothetical protein
MLFGCLRFLVANAFLLLALFGCLRFLVANTFLLLTLFDCQPVLHDNIMNDEEFNLFKTE